MIAPYYQDDAVTIYHGDCREILPQLKERSIEVLWTDPPYGHNNHVGDFNARLNTHRQLSSRPIAGDSPDEMRALLDFVLREAARFLTDCCCCCCCCCCGGGGPRPTFAWVADRLDRDGFSFFHSVIWDKLNPGLGWRFRRQHEMIMVAHRAGNKLRWADDDRAVSNVFSKYPDREREHPNQKPLELVAKFLSLVMLPGDSVVDPLMGSGTTLRAAKDLGFRAIGIDIEEEHCETAARRMEQEVLAFV